MNFVKINQKEWDILFDDVKYTVNLVPSSVTNKFHILTNFITGISETCGQEFDSWFKALLEEAQDELKRPQAVMNSIEKMKEYVDKYLDSLDIDYNVFVDESKAKKNSIFFNADEIGKIIRLSSYMKIYSVFANSENLKLGQKFHREVYNKIASDIADTDIVSKIFKVIQTKTFRYKQTDSFMWEYIKTVQCKDISTHVIEIFNFIMNHILILCEAEKNPITYFVGVVDESVKWFLRSVYKGSYVYDDTISTENIQGSERNNLKTYSFNDTLGRLKDISFEKIYAELERNNMKIEIDDQHIIDFHSRLENVEFISPLCQCLVYPVLAKITKIPYIHYKTVSPQHAAVLSYYTKVILEKVFKGRYSKFFELLEYYPTTNPSLTTTYTIKNVHEFLNIRNKAQNFFGFGTIIFPHKILCHFIGRVSRIQFRNLLDGRKLGGIPLSKIESDMIDFYMYLFSDKFEKRFDKMVAYMNSDF